MAIEVELWNCAAEGGSGRRLAQASIALDLSEFEAFKAQSASIELADRDRKVRRAVSLFGHSCILRMNWRRMLCYRMLQRDVDLAIKLLQESIL